MTDPSRSSSRPTTGRPVSEPKSPLLPYLALVALALLWGVSFLFIKIAVHDMSPTALVLIRSGSGFVALTLIVWAMRRPLLGDGWKRRVIPFAVMGVVNGVLPWFLIAWGEQRISSGMASILNATTPLWAAVLVYWLIPAERPSLINYGGVVIGLGGVVILVIPEISRSGLGGDTLGVLAVVLASVSYALAALFQRTRMRGLDVYQASLGQLAGTAVISLPFAIPALPGIHLDARSVGAALGLGVGGSAVAYLLYFYILNSLGPVRALGVTLLVPVTAVFWGVILLHEVLSVPIVSGMVVILIGIVLSNVRRRAPRREPVVEPADTAAA